MKNNYKVRAQKFIKMIYPYVRNCTNYDSYEIACAAIRCNYPRRRIDIAHGMSRVCFITSDYVVKIDYRKTQWGGCEDEIANYEFARQCGYEEYFAEITRFVFGGKTFYIMPRIENIDEDGDDAQWMIEDDRFNDWLTDNGFADLHSSNYGFKNGHVVIFDYACRQ